MPASHLSSRLAPLQLVPAECAIGQRLGFHVELVATLLTPVALLTLLCMLAMLLAPFARRARAQLSWMLSTSVIV